MPILALGKNGQLYATSPDRADGQGFGYAPECVDQQDVTLGSAYLKSQQKRSADILRAHRQQEMMDGADEAARVRSKLHKRAKAVREAAEARMYENPMLVDAITKRAVMSGCSCEYETALSGNALTHNGQSGFAGMTRDQQAIHNAVNGIGHNTAHPVDSDEMLQAQMRADAHKILRAKASR